MDKLIIRHTKLREYISRQAVIDGLKAIIYNVNNEEEFQKLFRISTELRLVNNALLNNLKKEIIKKNYDGGVITAIYFEKGIFHMLVEKNKYTYVKQISQGTCL